MQGMSVVAVALSALVHVGPVSAAENGRTQPIQDSAGQARTVNRPDPVVVIEDGIRLWLAEDRIVAPLREGVLVKLSYEERNGHHVVTRIETAE
jgi:hypothetical protein